MLGEKTGLSPAATLEANSHQLRMYLPLEKTSAVALKLPLGERTGLPPVVIGERSVSP